MSGAKRATNNNREFYTEIGINISFYRKRAGMTQEQLAEKANISRTHLGNIEATNMIKPFSLEVLFDIARVLDVHPYKLLQPKD